MKKMKKIMFLTLVFVLVMQVLSGCGGSGSSSSSSSTGSAPAAGSGSSSAASGDSIGIDGEYVIRIGMTTSGAHVINYTAEQYKERVEAETGGKIKVEIYPASQLGTTAQMLESALDGSLQCIMMPHAYFVNIAPGIAIIEMPFIFDAKQGVGEQCFRILNAGTSLDDYIAKKGLTPALWLRSGQNYIIGNMPFSSMADLKGRKIRCHTSEFQQAEIASYGAAPTQVDTGDLAPSLQNKTIDGVLADISFTTSQKTYEISPYFSLVPGGAITLAMMFSTAWFETLPQNVQEYLLKVAKEIGEGPSYDYYIKVETEGQNELRDNGAEVIIPSDAFLADLKSASASVHDLYKNKDSECAQIYDEFVALIKADSEAHK